MNPAILRQPCSPTDQFDGAHKHQCRHCGTTWAHADDLREAGTTDDEFELAHECPNCMHLQFDKVMDRAEFEKYEGSAPVTIEDIIALFNID